MGGAVEGSDGDWVVGILVSRWFWGGGWGTGGSRRWRVCGLIGGLRVKNTRIRRSMVARRVTPHYPPYDPRTPIQRPDSSAATHTPYQDTYWFLIGRWFFGIVTHGGFFVLPSWKNAGWIVGGGCCRWDLKNRSRGPIGECGVGGILVIVVRAFSSAFKWRLFAMLVVWFVYWKKGCGCWFMRLGGWSRKPTPLSWVSMIGGCFLFLSTQAAMVTYSQTVKDCSTSPLDTSQSTKIFPHFPQFFYSHHSSSAPSPYSKSIQPLTSASHSYLSHPPIS